MVFDPRDKLWEATYKTYFESFNMEIAAQNLIDRWQIVDELTKVLVALTASGSAVSGWTMWNNPKLKIIWLIVAGFGAVLAILHSALSVPSRLKHWGEVKQLLAVLRIDLETFMYQMTIYPEFSVDEFTREFTIYRKRYAEGIQKQMNDILWTRRLERKSLDTLNQRLKDFYFAELLSKQEHEAKEDENQIS